MRLPHSFYCQHPVIVAKNLLGKKLVFGKYEGIITETEAYRGEDDPASHAYKGKTLRNSVMFEEAGYVYVYMIYGIYYCVNIVTEQVGMASAVLIRGLKIDNLHLNGPGKVCKYLGITKKENKINLITNNNFYICEGINPEKIDNTMRIGITQGKELMWRFLINTNF